MLLRLVGWRNYLGWNSRAVEALYALLPADLEWFCFDVSDRWFNSDLAWADGDGSSATRDGQSFGRCCRQLCDHRAKPRARATLQRGRVIPASLDPWRWCGSQRNGDLQARNRCLWQRTSRRDQTCGFCKPKFGHNHLGMLLCTLCGRPDSEWDAVGISRIQHPHRARRRPHDHLRRSECDRRARAAIDRQRRGRRDELHRAGEQQPHCRGRRPCHYRRVDKCARNCKSGCRVCQWRRLPLDDHLVEFPRCGRQSSSRWDAGRGYRCSECFHYPSGCCYIASAGGVIVGGSPAPFNSQFRIFTITNGQIVLQYSSQGVSVASGSQTATVQVVSVSPSGTEITNTVVATVAVQLLAPGSASVSASPVDLTANGNVNQAVITISGLKDSDGVTSVPDGALVGLTAASNVAITSNGCCNVQSAGGTISSAGTSPGDGTTTPGNANFSQFTVAGGKVVATYSDAGVVAAAGETKQASVAVVPLSNSGSVLTTTAIAVGTVNLHGVTSAAANGPATMSRSANTTASVTFSGIKDSAGNTVPDGTAVVVTVAGSVAITSNGCCYVTSVGGAIVNGNASPSGNIYKVFTTVNGSITVTYSTAGASVGTANVQILPAKADGTVINNSVLNGGVWAITIK